MNETIDFGWRWWRPPPRRSPDLVTGTTYITREGRLFLFPWNAVDPIIYPEDTSEDFRLIRRPLVGGPARRDARKHRFDEQGNRLDGRIRADLIIPDPLPVYRQLTDAALNSALVAGLHRAALTPQEGDMAELAHAVDRFRQLGPEPDRAGRAWDDLTWENWIEELRDIRAEANLAGYSWWGPASDGRWLYDLAGAVEGYIGQRGIAHARDYETFLTAASPEIGRHDEAARDRLFLVVAESWRQAYQALEVPAHGT